jgi:uncharacterized protein with von Willebrand factor type A (vWA) domain
MNNEPSAHRPVDPDAEPPSAPPLGPDDIAVGHDDLSIIVEAASPAEPNVAGTEDLRAMSERLRRVEEELDGVFQTIGRLLRGGDASDPGGRRLAADAIRLEEIEKRLAETLAADRSRLSEALDEHFERIRRVLHEGAEPGSERHARGGGERPAP